MHGLEMLGSPNSNSNSSSNNNNNNNNISTSTANGGPVLDPVSAAMAAASNGNSSPSPNRWEKCSERKTRESRFGDGE